MDEKSKKSWQEKRNAFFIVLIVILVVLLSSVIVILKIKKIYGDNICISADCVTSSEFFLDIINNSVNPCDNFYEFACGGYQGQTSVLEEAQLKVLEEFKTFTIGSIKKDDTLAVKKQKKYYTTCMNTSAIEEDDSRSIKRIYEALGGWPMLSLNWVNVYNLGNITKKCVDLGLYYDWFIDVDRETDFLDNNQTLRISPPTNVDFIEIVYKENYQLLIENIIKRLRTNNNLDTISDAAKSIVEFENSLLQIISESGDSYENTTIDELKIGFPSLPWDALLKNVVMEENASVDADISYFSKLDRLLAKTSSRTKINYILWKITQSLYQFLPRDIRREFESYDAVVKNKTAERREKFCYQITKTVFAYVSEAAYAKKHASDRQTVEEIFKNIKLIMKNHINDSTWMNDTHKTYAQEKLQKVKIIIGGPDEVYDDNKLDHILGIDEIDILNLNNTLDIVRAVDKSRDKYNLDFRRKQLTFQKAQLYQDIVNIQSTKYLPAPSDIIYLPAAVIGGVFDSQRGLNFRNYSVLGIVLAHELTHAFGMLDIDYELNGKQVMRWSNSTFQAFLNQSECLMDQCLEFEGKTNNDTHCKKIYDENFADYTSVNVAYEAFKKIKLEDINQLPGFNYSLNQLFWISYATIMCDNTVSKTLNSTVMSKLGHLVPSHRILGSYRNSKYFSRDFSCSEGSYMNPADKCVVL